MKSIKVKKWITGAGLCVCGILINIAGTKLASALNLPLYLDSIGTVLVASLGGYLPGIIVGFMNNTINSLTKYTSAYYGSISMLIAVAAAWFARKEYYKKPKLMPLTIVVLALIGGGLGSVFTWFLFGAGFGNTVSSPLAQTFYDGGLSIPFLAQLSADLVLDLADKGFSVALVVLILRLLPRKAFEATDFYRWREDNQAKTAVRTVSLGTKIIALIAAAVLFVSAAVTVITVQQFNDASIENQYAIGESIVKVAAKLVDGNRVDEFIAKGEEAEDYLETKRELTAIMNSAPDITFVYVYRIEQDGCHVVFDLDTEELPGAAPGEIIDFDDAFSEYLPDLLAGNEIEPVISDETYGSLMTFYYPVRDDAGVCQCYAAVDISMPQILRKEQVFMARTISLFLHFFILLLSASVFLSKHYIINPINKITHAAISFDYNTPEARESSMAYLKSLNIHTGDEIEKMYQSYLTTTEDILRFIREDQAKSGKISKLQNGLILTLADVVESRDKCTGDHVRKTAAYANIIMQQLIRDGVYTDRLTDEFVADVVASAPLHDVGKVHISDAVLNSPGRLTDEEYRIMKEHTTIGAEIIRNAIETVSDHDADYLKEAQNLANYHHERWDGKGYPSGLAGEQIPLSARIMAVADVFDALYSKRSYKEGFSFEKSMGIIQEGAGTQFDPRIVEAFVRTKDEVLRVANHYRTTETGDKRTKAGEINVQKRASRLAEASGFYPVG